MDTPFPDMTAHYARERARRVASFRELLAAQAEALSIRELGMFAAQDPGDAILAFVDAILDRNAAL